jgi:hypothetical protein
MSQGCARPMRDWMSERGRTAVHIELVRRNAEIISGDHRYHGEGFVDFEQIDVIHCPARPSLSATLLPVMTSAAAPSEMEDALAAVMVPSLSKAGFSEEIIWGRLTWLLIGIDYYLAAPAGHRNRRDFADDGPAGNGFIGAGQRTKRIRERSSPITRPLSGGIRDLRAVPGFSWPSPSDGRSPHFQPSP